MRQLTQKQANTGRMRLIRVRCNPGSHNKSKTGGLNEDVEIHTGSGYRCYRVGYQWFRTGRCDPGRSTEEGIRSMWRQ
ncbi:protein of unknown function [Pseudomonas sp. JV241A]|nr:protein of unknown function [Pseudomonas sp. JV241A]